MAASSSSDAAERVQYPRQLQALARSLWISQAIYTAAELGVADALSDGPQTPEAVAAAVDAQPGTVKRLMRALVTLGLLDQASEDMFELAPLGSLMCSGTPDSMRNSVLLAGPRYRQHWGELANCVRTGHTAVKILDDIDDPFAAFAGRPDDLAIFNRSMAEACRQVAEPIVEAYDFAGIGRIVDVGGGYGPLVTSILAAVPGVQAEVFDLPWCESGASEAFEAAGLASRARFVAGSFFDDPVPAGADVYLLKSVIHDWDDDHAVAILRNCRNAATDTSRLLVIEIPVPAMLTVSPDHQRMAAADLNMMVSTGGQERTEADYGDLLERASFKATKVVPTTSGFSIIEAVPA